MWFQGGASGLPSYWQFPILYGNFGGGPRRRRNDGPGPGHPVGRARSRRGHAGRPERDPHAGRIACAARRRAPAATSCVATACRPTCRATTSTARKSRASSAACVPRRPEGVTRIRNYYDGNEFIKSTDPFFRPVDQATAPDGTIYIADMYHGIIQQATWSGPGTYLRARIEQYDLDKVIHKGRIWRLVYDGVRRDRSDAIDARYRPCRG